MGLIAVRPPPQPSPQAERVPFLIDCQRLIYLLSGIWKYAANIALAI